MEETNKYYVYEYVRLDTNEPFYIGKGSNGRWKDMRNRNKHFLNIVNNIGAACIILHDNLEENIALQYECWYIWQLRDIQGYWLLNGTDGGEGVAMKWSEERKKLWSETMKNMYHSGKIKNPNKPGREASCYGRTGEKHPLFGTEGQRGSKNGMFGKRGPLNPCFGQKRPKISENQKGDKNPNARKIALLKDNDIIKTFGSIQTFSEYAKENFPKPNSIATINLRLRYGNDFHGYKIIYL